MVSAFALYLPKCYSSNMHLTCNHFISITFEQSNSSLTKQCTFSEGTLVSSCILVKLDQQMGLFQSLKLTKLSTISYPKVSFVRFPPIVTLAQKKLSLMEFQISLTTRVTHPFLHLRWLPIETVHDDTFSLMLSSSSSHDLRNENTCKTRAKFSFLSKVSSFNLCHL